MKIIHTADLHLGQVLYQNYDRVDEHDAFFRQLKDWCRAERPDALLVSGDVFDIQQPSASTKKAFNDYFVDLHRCCPEMHIIITAGNHDSASRIQADRSVWRLGPVHLVGLAPATSVLGGEDGWQDEYIVPLEQGFVVAMPFMTGDRHEVLQSVLDRVAMLNREQKPVVMMGHQAVTGMDALGHGIEVGRLMTQDVDTFGKGYDYLALGHIHKPQTLGHQQDAMLEEVAYPSPVARYSGSALHVSCDEKYPHTVSLVEIDHHGGEVKIRQLRIQESRHFYELPEVGAFHDEQEALDAVQQFVEKGRGYLRLKFDYHASVSSQFNQKVYDLMVGKEDRVRYNPKIVWDGQPDTPDMEEDKPIFQVAELQQMSDPMDFIERTIDQYPDLNIEELRKAFVEIEEEVEL